MPVASPPEETSQAVVQAPHEHLLPLADRLARTIAVACALISAGRVVDLSGLQDGVGQLCAKTLDLHIAESRQMLPVLLVLMAEIDRLAIKVADQQPRSYPTNHLLRPGY